MKISIDKKYGLKVAKCLLIRKKLNHFQFGSTIYYDVWQISEFLKETNIILPQILLLRNARNSQTYNYGKKLPTSQGIDI